jgi:ATP adenylyltransferase
MDLIWAPWRIEYIRMEKPEKCVLCGKPRDNDDEASYILFWGRLNFIILNSFPYNPGHLMVAPYRHVAALDELTGEERDEHFALVACALKALRVEFSPGGFNIGANLGRVAGAGIEDHFHSHVVPRWQGDTNCMPVIADTKIINEALAETYEKLRAKF